MSKICYSVSCKRNDNTYSVILLFTQYWLILTKCKSCQYPLKFVNVIGFQIPNKAISGSFMIIEVKNGGKIYFSFIC